MTGRVIHTGQAIVDLVMTVPALPQPGTDVFATSHQITAGGGFNVMAAARRDGADVVYLGGHGTGRFGDIVRQALADEQITVTQNATLDLDTGFSVAIVDSDAERTFVSTVGAEGRLTTEDLNAAGVRPGDVVYVSGYSLYHPNNAMVIADWSGRLPKSVATVLDPSPMVRQIPDAIIRTVVTHSTVITANESEARALAARFIPKSTATTVEDLTHALADALTTTVIVRANRAGAWLAESGGPAIEIPPFDVAPIDTNGAGDAHTGILCAGLAAERDLLESVHRANAGAAIAVTRRGPATSPTASEIDEIASARPRRNVPPTGRRR
ncbi:PfkB family carbohydrate kinase [Tsukamurella sp. 8F]|uniref:PfkB family carbohydrate kinase n=1 Tax=unclassified Tsukamurella TaxID=2633480 RepID=UPI0023B9FCD5|nr:MULTISPECIES: PfkB family carbohydrate kinase [unclassified Tsukamurella]MDF0528765.1 PfkB family carbohydrate kinase [Tsukamurella sp. 8J]MDF0586600.1 PfkB family carbohydrate kinase [Tsukamurella sp. 8F]